MNNINFPDFLLPALVKDLRQTLRTPGFMILLASMLGLLTLMLYMASDTLMAGRSNAASIHTFWLIISATLCMIIPFRAYVSVNQDVLEDSTNFLILTGQSSWKIIMGKWLSSVVQVLMINITFIPFLIVYYVMSSQSPWMGFITLSMLSILSCIITAFMMFMAGMSVTYRIIAILAGLQIMSMSGSLGLGMIALTPSILQETFVGSWTSIYASILFTMDAAILTAGLLMLSRRFYAARSENCSWNLRRLTTIPWLLLLTCLFILPAEPGSQGAFIVPVQTGIAVILSVIFLGLDLTMPSFLLPVHYARIRATRFNIIPASLKLPGWVPSLAWIICIMIGGAMIFYLTHTHFLLTENQDGRFDVMQFMYLSQTPSILIGQLTEICIALLYTITFPLIIIIRLMNRLQKNAPLVYALILVSTLIAGMCISMMSQDTLSNPFLYALPGTSLIAFMFSAISSGVVMEFVEMDWTWNSQLPTLIACTVATLIILAVLSTRYFKEYLAIRNNYRPRD